MSRYRPDIPEFKNPKTGKDYTSVTNEMRMTFLAAKVALGKKIEHQCREELASVRRLVAVQEKTACLNEVMMAKMYDLMQRGEHDAVMATMNAALEAAAGPGGHKVH